MSSQLNETADLRGLVTAYIAEDGGRERQYINLRIPVRGRKAVVAGCFDVSRAAEFAAPIFAAMQNARILNDEKAPGGPTMNEVQYIAPVTAANAVSIRGTGRRDDPYVVPPCSNEVAIFAILGSIKRWERWASFSHYITEWRVADDVRPISTGYVSCGDLSRTHRSKPPGWHFISISRMSETP